ncbi:MAG: site-2 protease family protein [Gemmatimonadaceae bacterium]|nr:site-2 protease family protein [Gemmatimonadaceae bacterium]
MSWSFRIGKLFGIDVFMHVTFLLLLGFIGLGEWRQSRDIAAALASVGFFVALFACVLFHELGHALTARKFGIKTRDITLLPIGGLARLERMPEKPMQEFWVALAGPAVNVVIAAAIFAYLFATSGLVPVEQLSVTGGSFLVRLAAVNVMLVLFNMLPAFPMDGGRVLRALLATRMDYARATNIAARLGQAMAFVFGFLGLFSNPFLVLIALFVWIGAAQESGMVQMKSALNGLPTQRVMITEFRTLAPSDPLSRAADYVLAGFQQDFPVVETDGRLVGVLCRAALIGALAQRGPTVLASEVMQRDFQTADPFEMAEGVLVRLQASKCPSMPVMQQGKLVGILTAENIGEFLLIHAALKGDKPALAAAV